MIVLGREGAMAARLCYEERKRRSDGGAVVLGRGEEMIDGSTVVLGRDKEKERWRRNCTRKR